MRKQVVLNIICWCLLVAIIGVVVFARKNDLTAKEAYSDGIVQIDPNTIYFRNSDIEVDFSDVILSAQNETRLLKVSEQEATVSVTLTDRLIKGVDWKAFQKSQDVTYHGKGSFVVDLNTIDKTSLIEDKENHILTILIDHARLDAIDIDPNDIIIDEVNIGILNWGKINLTVEDYNALEKEIRNKLVAQFNTVTNGQEADDIAKRMVKDTYEPIVKAIDSRYVVKVEFK